MNNIVKVISLILGLGILLNLLAILSGTAQLQQIPIKETKEFKSLIEKLNEYEQALATGDPGNIAEAAHIVGKRYIDIYNIAKAKEWFFRSARIRRPLNDFYALGKTYGRLSECEIRLHEEGEINDLVKYSHLAKYYFFKAGTPRGQMSGFMQAATAHMLGWEAAQRNEHIDRFSPSLDSATYYLQKSLKLAIELKFPVDVALAYQNLSGVWLNKGNYLESVSLRKKAIEIYGQEGKTLSLVENCIFVGKDYIKMNQLETGKFWLDKARYIADTGRFQSQECGGWLSEAYSQYYERKGDQVKAISYLKRANEHKLQVERVYRETAFEGIRLSNEIEKHQTQLQTQKKELVSQEQKARLRFWLIILTSALLVVAAFAGMFYYGLFRKYRIISKVNAKLVQEQSHRFNNNLQKISDFLHLQQIEVSDPAAVLALEQSQLRVEAVALVHKLLYSSEELVEVAATTYIPDLIEAVLQSYSIKQVIVDYELDDVSIHVDQAITIGLIVTELTTNACKYALVNHEDPRLKVSYKSRDKTVAFSFRDNGSGLKKSDKSSFGLRLIDLLVLNLKGAAVFTSDRGTCFDLTFKQRS